MGTPDTSYELVEPFDIDDGSLVAVKPETCFALGVEWAMFRAKLSNGLPFTDTILADNADRLTKMAERAKRFVEARPAENGWAEITVGGYTV